MSRTIGMLAILSLAVLGLCTPAGAVILYDSAGRNLTQPDADNGLAAWNLQGTFGIYLGTPVGSKYFVTAAHVGAQSPTFGFQGGTYHIDTAFGTNGCVVQNDLALWKIQDAESFPAWATVYNGTGEIGSNAAIFGRGTDRGLEVINDGLQRGWYWGTSDSKQSWGRNVITQTLNDANYGGLLVFDFNGTGAVANEGTVSAGDSGGGVFVHTNGVWALAGLNLSSEAQFRTSANGATFDAAIFDARTLYYNFGTDSSPDWQQIPNGADQVPAGAFATRISGRTDFLATYVSDMVTVPEPATMASLLLGVIVLIRRKRHATI